MTMINIDPMFPRLSKAAIQERDGLLTTRQSTDKLIAECRAQRLGQIPYPPVTLARPRRHTSSDFPHD